MSVLNINVGLLGHVDSGKTSLARTLSEISSTAAFDKDPQSQERGITLDLGFSSFMLDIPDHLKDTNYEKVRYTLVDCPGHGDLMRTVIGGSHIIDIMIIVVDGTRGVQNQTSECLVIGEITRKRTIVAVNKVDLLNDLVIPKIMGKVRTAIDITGLKGSPIVCISAIKNNVSDLIYMLKRKTFLPERKVNKPFLFAIDHCFGIRGKGTVMTGTVLQGSVKLNDDIEIPSVNLKKRVKSIQMFKKPIDSAIQGDRIGICVTQFDPKLVERGLACRPNYVKKIYAALVNFEKVPYYLGTITSKSFFHVNVGYENTMATVLLFGLFPPRNSDVDKKGFDFDRDYKYIRAYNECDIYTECARVFALLEFTKPILVPKSSLVIGSKLDVPLSNSKCRFAFHGYVLHCFEKKNYIEEFQTNLSIYKDKTKTGIVDRMINDYEVIGKNMFKKETNIQKFLGMKVKLSTGENGVIESSFGQSGKFKVRVSGGLNGAKQALKNQQTRANLVEIRLTYKYYMYDPTKKMIQE